jgi:hypothetical protein
VATLRERSYSLTSIPLNNLRRLRRPNDFLIVAKRPMSPIIAFSISTCSMISSSSR